MSARKFTIDEKKDYAFLLYTRNKLDAKTVAQRTGVTEKTIGKWIAEGNWKAARNRLLISKENQINLLYEQLESLNNLIQNSETGHADTKQADILIKYTAAIKNLETDLNIGDLVESGIRFIKHLQQTAAFETVQEVLELWDGFLQSQIASR